MKAPLMRLLVARVDDDRHWCVWTHHHVILDGWSCSLVLKEVAAMYGADATGEGLYLPPARPYRDYIAWLQQQDNESAEAFWRDALAEVSEPTPLPRIDESITQPRSAGRRSDYPVPG